MTLRLRREPTVDGVTLGALSIDGVWCCWTLEDAIREAPGQPVASWKVDRQTAIPHGTYRLRLSLSHRFDQVLPELLEVPGFSGIRIHAGNTIEDTAGCVLVGRNRVGSNLTGSRVACHALIEQLARATDPIVITIEDPEA